MPPFHIAFLDRVLPLLAEALTDAGFICKDYAEASRAEVLAALPHCQGIVLRSRLKVDRELIDAAPGLRFIARWGVGTEHIDLDYARARGVAVFTSPEGSRDTVAEHTVGLLLMLLNHLGRADRQVRDGQWLRAANRGTELGGKTVGILGYGNMGQAFAQRLQGFGCRVITYDKYREHYGDNYAEAVSLAQLQAEADILSLHIFYEGNHYLVDADYLAAFAKPIYLINTARGGIVKTTDLVAALATGQVRGAALDVIEYEEQSFVHLDPRAQPAPFQQLLAADNVLLTPHIAGWSHEAETGHGRTLARKIIAAFGN
jgi:D-3-phosphoglycerate dehydrogenase